MSQAVEETTRILGIKGDERKRQAVAKLLIRLAQGNDSPDATTLRDQAVAALGGDAYGAHPLISQSSKLRAAK